MLREKNILEKYSPLLYMIYIFDLLFCNINIHRLYVNDKLRKIKREAIFCIINNLWNTLLDKYLFLDIIFNILKLTTPLIY